MRQWIERQAGGHERPPAGRGRADSPSREPDLSA
jgi:hypothetical protein